MTASSSALVRFYYDNYIFEVAEEVFKLPQDVNVEDISPVELFGLLN